MDEQDLRRRAEERVAARASILRHATTYLIVNAFLFALDWWPDARVDWAYWPAFGWGVGLISHTVSMLTKLGGDREAAVEREMEKLRRRAAR